MFKRMKLRRFDSRDADLNLSRHHSPYTLICILLVATAFLNGIYSVVSLKKVKW